MPIHPFKTFSLEEEKRSAITLNYSRVVLIRFRQAKMRWNIFRSTLETSRNEDIR